MEFTTYCFLVFENIGKALGYIFENTLGRKRYPFDFDDYTRIRNEEI